MGQTCGSKCGCKQKDSETENFTDLVSSSSLIISAQNSRQAYPAPPGNPKSKKTDRDRKGQLSTVNEDKSTREDDPVDYSVFRHTLP